MTQFTIGCDPEVFVARKGKIVSAHGLVPGDKKNPYPVPGGALQVDGMALEFNIDPVDIPNNMYGVSGSHIFSRRVLNTMRHLRDNLPEGHTLRIEPFFEFSKDYLESQPDDAKELGCDPDMNAYTLEPNPAPDKDVLYRTTAGHIHIGWGQDIPVDHPDHLAICAQTIKTLDAVLGVISVVLDDDVRRRQLYGKAGAFRAKPYGVEYRTPSNFWLKNDYLRRWVYNATRYALNYLSHDFDSAPQRGFDHMFQGRIPYSEDIVQEIINTANKQLVLDNFREMSIWDNNLSVFDPVLEAKKGL